MPPCHRMKLSCRNPWRAESSASVVRRASCTLALFKHSHPIPFLIRAKNIFSESDFSWEQSFSSVNGCHWQLSTGIHPARFSAGFFGQTVSGHHHLLPPDNICKQQWMTDNDSSGLPLSDIQKQHGKMVTNKLYYVKITNFICINDKRWNTVERCHLKAEAINFFHPKQVGKILAILP